MPKLGYPVHGVGEAEYLSPSFHPSQSQAPPCPGKSPRCREAPVRGEVGPFPPAPLTLSSPQWTPWPTWLSCSVNISWSEHCIAWPSPAPAPDRSHRGPRNNAGLPHPTSPGPSCREDF